MLIELYNFTKDVFDLIKTQKKELKPKMVLSRKVYGILHSSAGQHSWVVFGMFSAQVGISYFIAAT